MRLYISIASERPYLGYCYILFAVLGGGHVNIRVCSRPFKAAVSALAAGLILPAAYSGTGNKFCKGVPPCALIPLYQHGMRQPVGFDCGGQRVLHAAVSYKRKAHSTNPTFFIALK